MLARRTLLKSTSLIPATAVTPILAARLSRKQLIWRAGLALAGASFAPAWPAAAAAVPSAGEPLPVTASLGSRPPVRSSLDAEFQPFFIRHAKAAVAIQNGFELGVDYDTFDRGVNALYLRMCQTDMLPVRGEEVSLLAARIRDCSDRVISADDGLALTKLGKEWFLAEAIGAWVRIYVKVDRNLTLPGVIRRPYEDPKVVLAQDPPAAVCGGYTNLVRDLAKAAGLRCEAVPGETRPYGTLNRFSKPGGVNNHAWNCFLFSDGSEVPLEATQTRVSVPEVARAKGKIGRDAVLPKRAIEWELFLSVKYGVDSERRDQRNIRTLTDLPYKGSSP